MGAGASAGIAEAVHTTSEAELRTALASLNSAEHEKVKAALAAACKATHSKQEIIEITVTMVSGDTKSISASLEATGLEVKKQLALEWDMPPDEQQLICGTAVLEDKMAVANFLEDNITPAGSSAKLALQLVRMNFAEAKETRLLMNKKAFEFWKLDARAMTAVLSPQGEVYRNNAVKAARELMELQSKSDALGVTLPVATGPEVDKLMDAIVEKARHLESRDPSKSHDRLELENMFQQFSAVGGQIPLPELDYLNLAVTERPT
eukprot:gnl/TRDRNA2_/TRDRNA2_61390_c0_seq1.p1 gnl/TRDRNA2_/TRDRNA2_61390_c0~~gnl/TRDRNA2_/TRDRNA2_61390_c0_seq1.p1  ORF type:complete len:264 (+),score=59.85 gnl/TRDRNA2_/TRDRNA2_61390_c0_seq1:114-905(+)